MRGGATHQQSKKEATGKCEVFIYLYRGGGLNQVLGVIEWLMVTWFCENAEQYELEDKLVRFRGIAHLVASVSFNPTGGKLVLGPKKEQVRCIDCETVDDYSDWDTFCLIQLDHLGGPELLVVRQEDLETPSIN